MSKIIPNSTFRYTLSEFRDTEFAKQFEFHLRVLSARALEELDNVADELSGEKEKATVRELVNRQYQTCIVGWSRPEAFSLDAIRDELTMGQLRELLSECRLHSYLTPAEKKIRDSQRLSATVSCATHATEANAAAG